MDHGRNLHEDYLHCDKVWQRVAPELDPYPEVRAGAMTPVTEAAESCSLVRSRETAEKLRDFIERELADRRLYLEHMRCAPAAARRILQRFAADEYRHAEMLLRLLEGNLPL